MLTNLNTFLNKNLVSVHVIRQTLFAIKIMYNVQYVVCIQKESSKMCKIRDERNGQMEQMSKLMN